MGVKGLLKELPVCNMEDQHVWFSAGQYRHWHVGLCLHPPVQGGVQRGVLHPLVVTTQMMATIGGLAEAEARGRPACIVRGGGVVRGKTVGRGGGQIAVNVGRDGVVVSRFVRHKQDRQQRELYWRQ